MHSSSIEGIVFSFESSSLDSERLAFSSSKSTVTVVPSGFPMSIQHRLIVRVEYGFYLSYIIVCND